jgi:hypothetical protein
MSNRTRRVDGPTRITDEEAEPASREPDTRRLKFPSALTVLAIVLVATWVASSSFVIPSGVYELDETGAPVPGSYRELPASS